MPDVANKPLHTVAFTASFLKDCAAAGLDDAALKLIGDTLAADPEAGERIRDSAGARKVRVARPGEGKRGGYRLITAYVGAEAPVYALALYAKNERANLSAAEVKALASELKLLKAYWRQRTK